MQQKFVILTVFNLHVYNNIIHIHVCSNCYVYIQSLRYNIIT